MDHKILPFISVFCIVFRSRYIITHTHTQKMDLLNEGMKLPINRTMKNNRKSSLLSFAFHLRFPRHTFKCQSVVLSTTPFSSTTQSLT